MAAWEYDRGDGRRKHCWEEDFAGFVEEHGVDVGKCPKSITDGEAKKLLNGGVPYWAEAERQAGQGHPGQIFNVRDGVPYRAVPTNPGRSYHGFPCKAHEIPPEVLPELEKRAKIEDRERELAKWLRKSAKKRARWT